MTQVTLDAAEPVQWLGVCLPEENIREPATNEIENLRELFPNPDLSECL